MAKVNYLREKVINSSFFSPVIVFQFFFISLLIEHLFLTVHTAIAILYMQVDPARCYHTVSGCPLQRRVLFSPSDFMEGGMPMTILDLISILSYTVAIFQLGYFVGNDKREKK